MNEQEYPRGPFSRAVASNIKRLRGDQGLTHVDLENKIDQLNLLPRRSLHRLAIGRVESGRKTVDPDELIALSIALDVSPITLLMPEIGQRDGVDGTELTGEKLWAWLRADEPYGVAPGDRIGRARLAFLGRAVPEWVASELADVVRQAGSPKIM
ncbi:helix-turn-helix transcriptional regulator [Nocardia terpenica]|uniref:helix-turn-helix domain-containing protein n=1 Tax=Nocardia terpenica TaxID=455432 RepID=UPI001894D3E0|nr:helix-turn-helix transcriptional regulator [Nocardia terpenica]MBF6060569.1 helix-turn-helix transcriptional regulator [Nocardia terpenica]MBF6103829.1 helix-turn-helix transcriptional regulator [Nocardia terpenica]MBF6111797.1 helix-turn-helix transcriptional regulator [Nocardia terpenica]MBF6118050.1 helix-turn-helix transcriptional regulator [Nocardia terpenica]MBF6155224.1 helix-turn-helix transcriptional regulator [Nocardia terpenica]